jgi:uncharacterized protein YbaR (Trm112 family)
VDISIYSYLFPKIICPVCKCSGRFELTITNANDGEGIVLCQSCRTSFPVSEGILDLSSKAENKLNRWDELYNQGIKGNQIRTVDEVARFLNNGLNNVPSLSAFYPLIGLINNLNAKFTNSIEIGSGTGSYSLLLKKLNLVKNAILIDSSISALKISKALFENLNVPACHIHANGLDLPFVSKSFDISLSGGLIEHFKGEEQTRLISEHCRVGKTVICQVPTQSFFYWLQRAGITMLNGKWPFGYEKPISLKQLDALFRESNFVLSSHNYHDFITMALFRLSYKIKFFRPLKSKTALNRFTKTEIVAYFVPLAY